MLKCFLFTSAFIFSAVSCHAVSLAITNPGFETNFVADGQFNSTITPAGWSTYDPGAILSEDYNDVGVLNPTGTGLYIGGAPELRNVALIFLWPQNGDSSDVGLSQQLSGTLQPNMHYTLTVEVGNIADIGGAPFSLTGFPGYQIQLLANNVLLAMDDNTLSPGEGEFELSTVEFTTGATHPQLGTNLGIRLINLNNINSGIEVNFDDVKLDATAVPEPSMGMLALLGAAALGALRRRKS